MSCPAVREATSSDRALFSFVARRPPRGRPSCAERHHLRHPQRPALARCAGGVRAAQDAVQPVHSFIRWSRLGVFDRIFQALARRGGKPDRIMIDATHLKAHRTAASLLKKGCSPPYRAHQRRTELQAACGVRWPGAACRAAAFGRTDEQSQGRGIDTGRLAARQRAHRRSWIRQRRVSRGSTAKAHYALHPSTQEPKGPDRLRHKALP